MVKRGPVKRHLRDTEATLELGHDIARVIRPGLIIYLRGELGSGKTTLVRGILSGLGYHGHVKSPTFNLIELYKISGLHLHHFDFYRLRHPLEWKDVGFDEHFTNNNVCLVEWPENAGGLPGADITILLQHAPAGREVLIAGETEIGKQCLSGL